MKICCLSVHCLFNLHILVFALLVGQNEQFEQFVTLDSGQLWHFINVWLINQIVYRFIKRGNNSPIPTIFEILKFTSANSEWIFRREVSGNAHRHTNTIRLRKSLAYLEHCQPGSPLCSSELAWWSDLGFDSSSHSLGWRDGRQMKSRAEDRGGVSQGEGNGGLGLDEGRGGWWQGVISVGEDGCLETVIMYNIYIN